MKLNHHGPQDYQSLLMHQEAVRMLKADPALAERLLKTLARWDARLSVRSKPLRDRWVDIIKCGDWALATEESELGIDILPDLKDGDSYRASTLHRAAQRSPRWVPASQKLRALPLQA